LQDLDTLIDKTLKDQYPLLFDILVYKIDGLTNKEISKKIKEDYDIQYSIEYISSLWRKKIPKILSDKAKENWIIWHYTE